MKPYITYREDDGFGNQKYYILQKEFPHFIGVLSESPIHGSLATIPIHGYNLWISFAGTIRGNIIPQYQNIQDEIQSIYNSMASWFYKERIMVDEKRYKKFKIISDDNSTS